MDYYRPEYRLDRLRMMILDNSSNKHRRQKEEPLLHLRWLRTIVVDLSYAADADVDERLALQQCSAIGCAVERVLFKGKQTAPLSRLLPFLTQSVPILTSLDLRACCSDKLHTRHFAALAEAHRSSLRRLYLPWQCIVTQSTLDRFTQLEELDASGCQNLTNVDFCSATLRVLYANSCHYLTDAGLRRATRLEVLHVSRCDQVTDVSPFAHCLLELDVSYDCGIGSEALSECCSLQVLNADSNETITTLQPFTQQLRELNAGSDSSPLDDAALADATGLVSLSMSFNGEITTVAPFGASLRRLNASYSNIGDADLVTATNLVYLNASWNKYIRSLPRCSALLLELDVSGRVQVDDAALSAATNLIWLDLSGSERITTLQSCGRSLRHLVARGKDCALTNKGLSTATQLVTFYVTGSRNLTTIQPFLYILEELRTDSTAMLREVGSAPQLHCVRFDEESVDLSAVSVQLKAHGFVQKNDSWVRKISLFS